MRPILTVEKLVRAQQEAIKVYHEYGRIGSRDVYAILGLNIDQADGFYIEDDIANDDIRAFVRMIAYEHCIVQQNNDLSYEHNGPIIAKIHQQAFNILSGPTTMPSISSSDLVSAFVEKNLNVKEKKCMWNYDEQGNLLKEAEQKLNKILNEKGRLIRKDIWDALGITMANSRDFGQQVLMEKDEGNGLNRRTKEAIELTFDQVYLPYKLPRGLNPVKMWQTDNGYTTIQWSDSTTTSVKAENEGRATPYGGFCACVLKKLYGSTGQAIKMMQRADKNAKLPAEKKRIEREALKKFRQARAEIQRNEEAKRHERMVKLQMEEIYAKREAERRVDEADEKKVYEP